MKSDKDIDVELIKEVVRQIMESDRDWETIFYFF